MDTLSCSGTVTMIDAFTTACTENWVVVVSAIPFDPAQIDPAMLSVWFGAGFLMLVPIWVAIVGGRALIKAIGY